MGFDGMAVAMASSSSPVVVVVDVARFDVPILYIPFNQ